MRYTSFEFWKDPGFTEGCFEILGLDSGSLTSPDSYWVGSEGIRPSKQRFFNSVRVPIPYLECLELSYLRAVVLDNTDDLKTFYGWIDNVEIISDDPNRTLTEITWHVDFWNTYKTEATFGYGHVVRRPVGGDWSAGNVPYPIQTYNYVYKKKDTSIADQSLFPFLKLLPSHQITPDDNSLAWVIVSATRPSTEGGGIRYFVWPVCFDYRGGVLEGDQSGRAPIYLSNEYFANVGGIRVNINTEDLLTGVAIPAELSFRGEVATILGINSENIVTAWLSPIGPFKYSNIGTEPHDVTVLGEPYSTDHYWIAGSGFGLTLKQGTHNSNNYVFFELDYAKYIAIGGEDAADWSTSTIQGATTDTREMRVLGWDGVSLGTLPLGMTVDQCSTRLILSAMECQVEIRFNGVGLDNEFTRSHGLLFSYPCVNLDISSNSWSSYVYSGQRQYDIDMRDEQSIKSGTQSMIKGGTTGLLGAVAGPIGALVGALGGAALGSVNMATELVYFNDQFQEAEDRLHAEQANGLLTSGAAFDNAAMYNRDFILQAYTFDDYSLRVANETKELVGVSVDEEVADCQSLIANNGFLQIKNLIVGGPIPPQAKKWMKDKFASGVRLI